MQFSLYRINICNLTVGIFVQSFLDDSFRYKVLLQIFEKEFQIRKLHELPSITNALFLYDTTYHIKQGRDFPLAQFRVRSH